MNGRDIIEGLRSDKRFSYLKLDPDFTDFEVTESKQDFNSRVKSAIYLRDALQNPLRCPICHGLIFSQSLSIDHKTRKEDGGLGVADNGQIAHYYCNTTDKN